MQFVSSENVKTAIRVMGSSTLTVNNELLVVDSAFVGKYGQLTVHGRLQASDVEVGTQGCSVDADELVITDQLITSCDNLDWLTSGCRSIRMQRFPILMADQKRMERPYICAL